MKVDHFDPPGNNPDLGTDAALKQHWTDWMSNEFDVGVASVQSYLDQHGGGKCQFYNPLTNPPPGDDLPLSAGDIPWNGFPKRYGSVGPGQAAQYAKVDSPVPHSTERDQDEYLEWFVNRIGGKIVSVHFTCEAWDYFEFLGATNEATKAKVLELYKTWISPEVKQADLFPGGTYDKLNKWNTQLGAMHLTNSANNLFAEVFLAASATVRRQQGGAELTASIPLITCSRYGEADRNSDPAIGAAVNGLARDGRHITLANPVGLYISAFNGGKLTLDGKPAGGLFKVVRGQLPLGLRAVFELPAEQVAKGFTVSDVKIGGNALQYGGQLAELITMHLVGVASKTQDVHNTPVAVCGAVQQVQPQGLGAHAVAAAGLQLQRPTRSKAG